MGSGASSATPCLAGFFALRCFSLITIWVTPESWAVKLITSLPHWFYTRILRVPKCFPAVGPSLDANSLHNSGKTRVRTVTADSDKCCVGIPFASRFRFCVKRVAGASIFELLELPDHKVRNIHSAKGPKACFQSLEVSESWAANSPVSRQ